MGESREGFVVAASIGEVEHHPGWRYEPECESHWERFQAGAESGEYLLEAWLPGQAGSGWHVNTSRNAPQIVVSELELRLLVLKSPEEAVRWWNSRS